MTEEQVYQHLLEAIKRAGGQRPFAQQIKVTPSYINDVVNKRRLMSDRILAVIGIERVITVTYQQIEKDTDQDTIAKQRQTKAQPGKRKSAP